MTDPPGISNLFRRSLETSLRFYQGLGRLSVDYVRNMSAILTESVRSAPQARQSDVRPASSPIVLEAEAAEQAEGLFIVENKLPRKVSAEVVVSPLVDPDGREVEQNIYFEPAVVSAAPGEQIVVRVVANIDERLEPGVGYRGSLTVPGVSEGSAAVVVRRRHSVESPNKVQKAPPKKAKREPRRAPSRARRRLDGEDTSDRKAP